VYDVVALVGSSARVAYTGSQSSLNWHACELFSRSEVERAVAGCDFVVYLVHTRGPTARLDQAACEDMDLLIADNVARAAARHNVRQIVFLGGLTPRSGHGRRAADRRGEVPDALAFYGTPVTTLRAGLVVAPGGSTVELLASHAARLPVVLVPKWALNKRQPIAVTDVARGIEYCLGREETYGQEFTIGGPVVLGHRELLQNTAEILGKSPRFVVLPWFPRPLLERYLRLLDPGAHPALVKLAVENLADDTVADDSEVQRHIAREAARPRDMVEAEIRQHGGRLPDNPRAPFFSRHLEGLRSMRSVRSIQRIALPADRDATWVAGHYFRWLPKFAWPFVTCEVDERNSCRIGLRWPRVTLLELTFKPRESARDRRMYYVTGGLLARRPSTGRPRLEFRDVLRGRSTIVAIHDFQPQLPWFLYRATQAGIHLVVMRAFQRHMLRLTRRNSAKAADGD
jgi:nucleoside-diphosphate-sugar epimerase